MWLSSPCVGWSPLGWQFTQRGLCRTARIVSKDAIGSPPAGGVADAGAGACACEHEIAATAAAREREALICASCQPERQRTQPLPGQAIDGVGHRRRDGRCRGLANTAHLRVALE